MSQPRFPVSPRQEVGGLVYLPRMFDKIRLFAAGELGADYHSNLGTGFDQHVGTLFGLSYEAIRARVLEGGDDEAILAWCCSQGQKPNAGQMQIWNGFMQKYGWRDEMSERLAQRKAQFGLSDREDIQCFFDFLDADEGRS